MNTKPCIPEALRGRCCHKPPTPEELDARLTRVCGAWITEYGLEDRPCPFADPPDRTQVEAAREFICEQTARLRYCNHRVGTSYTWKHTAERATFGSPATAYRYVTNGAFIQACVEEGVKVRRVPVPAGYYGHPSVWAALRLVKETP